MRYGAYHFRARQDRAFTLIEILIVGALIVLFAGIAVISIQEIYNNNVRKATLGETNQLGTALTMAQQHLGFFPKLGFLIRPASLLVDSADDKIYDYFDAMGFYNEFQSNLSAPNSILERWQTGGYFAMSQGRDRISQGRGGSVRMRVGVHQNAAVVDWPADPWGNPYVVYLLKVNEQAVADGDRVFWRFTTRVTDKADYKVMVVSYGPNGAPGAVWRKNNPNDPYGTGTGDVLRRTTTNNMLSARLYLEDRALPFTPLPPPAPQADFTMINPAGYLSELRKLIIDGPDRPTPAQLAYWNDSSRFEPPISGTEIRGIMDPGTDDLVFEF